MSSRPVSPNFDPSSNPPNPIEIKINQLSEQLAKVKIGSANNENELAKIMVDVKSIKETFLAIADDVKDINSMKNLYNDLNSVKIYFQGQIDKIFSSLQQLHSSIDLSNLAIQQNAAQISDISRSSAVSRDVPELSYALFTGKPQETREFIYYIKEKLEEKHDCFRSEKAKINWIARHFRFPNGNLGVPSASHKWWMAILYENARAQDLPTESASVSDPYVLDYLSSADAFLSHLATTFDDKHDAEDAKRKLFAFRQGNRTIEEFNALFNALCYDVNLNDEIRCDVYEKALNPKILRIAVVRGDWKSATTLKAKQLAAVSAAEAQEKLNVIDSGSLPSIHFRPQIQPPPRLAPPPVRPPDGPAPMDLDMMSADTCFNFPRFRAVCRKKHVCQRCLGSYDSEHRSIRGCIHPDSKHSVMDQKVEIYKKWISEGGQDVKEALAEVAQAEKAKPSSSARHGQVSLDDIHDLSLGELCWHQAAQESGMDIDREIS
ncbi:hypothetical protein MJO28_012189 [Puccinia striiformis f. sp. tritici]|uniref:Uncharacterized protein n=1 Tax=Puccinia striiformis f. sp. tritici TaxID=168172 RepID=A0ACC0DZM4_9BASI|nr:hypothetical protein MJO28_012189 [Puccinia striiformis f. sp. tritici]